jgi:predicted secreted Zn-dependent protease
MMQPITTQCSVLKAQVDQITESYTQQTMEAREQADIAHDAQQANEALKEKLKLLELENKEARELVAMNHEKGIKYDQLSREHEGSITDLRVHTFKVTELEGLKGG